MNTLPSSLRTSQVVLRRHDPFRHILLGHDEGACCMRLSERPIQLMRPTA